MKTKTDWLTGCATALVTPFHKDGSVDLETFEKLAKRQISGGVKILVPCGTTGEAAAMTENERIEVIRTAVAAAKGTDAKVVAGTGSNSTAATIDFTRKAREAGADAALVVVPYYNKPTQDGIYAHFAEVSRSVKDLPIVMYNVPSRTVANMSAETALKLAADHDNIVATKEASGDLSQIMQIIRRKPKGFKVLAGDDAAALGLIALGAEGLVSVISNEMPKDMAKMVEHALSGAYHFARKIHFKLLPLMEANFVESSPAPCKFVMKEMGLLEENLRLPLVPVSKAARTALTAAMNEVGVKAK